jgi:hypothetical protein
MNLAILRVGGVLSLTLCFASPSPAAAMRVLEIDMPALIDKVADQPERFAVDVPQRFSTSTEGRWSSTGATRTWSYSVQVPSSVSMSFHASRLVLPSSAVLTVTGARASIAYRTRDVSRGGLWSRPMVGDTISFSLSVAAADAGNVVLEVESLQAGYKGLGGLPSHPYFMHRMSGTAGAAQSCLENYSCDASSGNQGPARGVVAVLIGNLYQCTGTLLNDARSDFAPYILTARHCETGSLGGGAPQAANTITVYWDAVSPCGAALGTIYDGGAPLQGNATTVVEQQDAWLIQLDSAPVAGDAYWAGWDASGAVFTGGYSIHHALGSDKQYVAWYGQAILQTIPAKTLGIDYDSTFWGLVNQFGSVGAGASGAAVFDPNNRVVGSATFAALQNGANSTGVCPVTSPPVPTASTVTAQYTALSSVFASIADSTSTTTNATLQSVLDPDHTGTLAVDGVGSLPVSLSADQNSLTTFDTLTLSWNAPGAQSCTASGGLAADGWAGTKSVSGTARIMNSSTGGPITYSLTCTGPGLKGSSSVNVEWIYIPPLVSLDGAQGPVSIGGSFFLQWSSNVSPCVASGGIAGDGWAGVKTASSGQQNVTTSQLGTINFSITCGTAPQSATAQISGVVVPVSVSITADSTRVRIGSTIQLNWVGGGTGDNCAGVGGSATDNWVQQIALNWSGEALITESTPGTYTYGIHCTGGGQSADSSVRVVFTNDPPTLTLSAGSPTQQVYPQLPAPSPTADLLWSSNVTPCFIFAIGPLGNTGVAMQGQYPSGTATDAEQIAGQYTYELQCGAYQASTTITWTNSSPKVTLTSTAGTTWVANYPYSLFWTSNTTPCTQTGGVAGDGWAGNYQAGQASQAVTEIAPGTYTFSITCGAGISVGEAQLTVTVPPAAASISASPSSVPVGQSTTLTWNSTVSPCTTVDASGGVNWGGSNVAPGGSIPIIETAAGAYTYSITCGAGSQMVHASTKVTVQAAPPTSISASVMSTVVNTPVTLTWSSSGAPCTATGGAGSDGWSGTKNAAGTATVTTLVAGTLTYGITCNNDYAQTQVAYTAPSPNLSPAPTPQVTLTSNVATQIAGQTVTLSWDSKNTDSCAASGGAANDGWIGALALSGSMQITESSGGSTTYSITCTGAPPAATAQAIVNFTEPAGSGTTGSSKGGGGGSMTGLWLLLLSLPVVVRVRRIRRCQRVGIHALRRRP